MFYITPKFFQDMKGVLIFAVLLGVNAHSMIACALHGNPIGAALCGAIVVWMGYYVQQFWRQLHTVFTTDEPEAADPDTTEDKIRALLESQGCNVTNQNLVRLHRKECFCPSCNAGRIFAEQMDKLSERLSNRPPCVMDVDKAIQKLTDRVTELNKENTQ